MDRDQMDDVDISRMWETHEEDCEDAARFGVVCWMVLGALVGLGILARLVGGGW